MQARACQRNPKCGYLCAQRNASASAKMLGTTFLTGSTRCSPSIMFFIELSSSTAIIILQDHYIPSLPYTMQWYSSLPVIQVIYYSVIIPVIYMYLYPSDTSYTSSIPLLHSDTCKIPLYHAVVYLYNISASSIPVIYLCYLSIYIPVIYLYNTMQQYLYTSSIYHAVIPLLPLYIYTSDVSIPVPLLPLYTSIHTSLSIYIYTIYVPIIRVIPTSASI